DPLADAMYIYFNQKPVKETVAVDKDLIIDYGSNRVPVGIEMLSVSKKMSKKSLLSVKVKLLTHQRKLLLQK
ncbi:MAG: DUF2283 domain-containing protein, partial [candidate division WOR-3 bacterium]